jgi:hypothetical protein
MQTYIRINFPEEDYKKGRFTTLIEMLKDEYSLTEFHYSEWIYPHLNGIINITQIENIYCDCMWYGSEFIKVEITNERFNF